MADVDLRKLRYFVAVPELLLVLAPPLLEPLLEQAANATRAATEPTAPNVRSLNGRELIADHLRGRFLIHASLGATG